MVHRCKRIDQTGRAAMEKIFGKKLAQLTSSYDVRACVDDVCRQGPRAGYVNVENRLVQLSSSSHTSMLSH